ncbi:MAG TPA: hypothetical protein VMU34_08805 [Mycobacterium sp.]|nr:hypothetical protein [Mycobacterium sp.]
MILAVTALLTACAGFLLAVLWMDLIFDAQLLGHRGEELPEPVLAGIAGYYHRATTTSRPMSLLIAVVMAILLSAIGAAALRGGERPWLLIASALLAGAPILLALTRTVPAARRLGRRVDPPARQSRLARSILRDHVFGLAAMSVFLVLWLTQHVC